MAFSLASTEFNKNPYRFYAQLRKDPPIVVEESVMGKALFLSRYDDVLSVLKDPRFSSESRKVNHGRDVSKSWWMPSIFKAFLNSMVMVDEPDHGRLRTLVHKAFTPRMIQQMSLRIEEISNKLLDQAQKKPVADLIADFALPLPLTVISEMMGVPEQDRHKFHRMMGKFLDATSTPKPASLLTQLPNALALNNFFKRLIASRRTSPSEDLISALVQTEEQGDTLSEDELVAMLFLLLLAGHETTVNLIGNGTLALMEHPDQLAKLQANPKLLDSAIEEILRFTNPVQHVSPRYALEDVELGGHFIPKGSTVIVGIASANRDETIFENADTFDISRDPNRHIAFGMGIHYCLGAPLARLEANIAFSVLLARFPNLKLAIPTTGLEWRQNSALRGLKSLPIFLKQ